MDRATKQQLIHTAYNHNDKARRMASCNAHYMGSMATALLIGKLGGQYGGRDSLDTLIENATDEQLDAGLVECEHILKSVRATAA